MKARLMIGCVLLLSLASCTGTIQHREGGGHYCRPDVRCPYGDF